MRSPIWWFGGKGNMVAKLLPLIPPHRTYVEPYGGGASLLFAKNPSPVEVYNDLNQAVVELKTRENVYQAALAVASRIMQTSLVNYIDG